MRRWGPEISLSTFLSRRRARILIYFGLSQGQIISHLNSELHGFCADSATSAGASSYYVRPITFSFLSGTNMYTDFAVGSFLMLLGILALSCYLLNCSHGLRAPRILDHVYWTIRSHLHECPLGSDFSVWSFQGQVVGPDVFETHMRRCAKYFDFLQPFFASHGYELYTLSDATDASRLFMFPNSKSPPANREGRYPHASCYYKTETDARFHYLVCRTRSIGSHLTSTSIGS